MSTTREVLAWIGKSVHDISGTLATAAGAIAIMDPQLVLQTLGPKATPWALLIVGITQLSKAQQERMRAAAPPPTVSPPESHP